MLSYSAVSYQHSYVFSHADMIILTIVMQVTGQCSVPDFCQASWAGALGRPSGTPAQIARQESCTELRSIICSTICNGGISELNIVLWTCLHCAAETTCSSTTLWWVHECDVYVDSFDRSRFCYLRFARALCFAPSYGLIARCVTITPHNHFHYIRASIILRKDQKGREIEKFD